ETIVTWGLNQSIEGIWKEVQAFIRYQRGNTAEQLKALHKIEHELCRKGEELRKDRYNLQKMLAATAERARGVLLNRRLKEELAPLEEELKQWDGLSRQKDWMEVSL
ncbi:MAG: hypothetical protein Q4P84_01080, partial [Elusimicrobiales bacterium]|nr:hypothetical protein [Elusimicrobiales bacterium]